MDKNICISSNQLIIITIIFIVLIIYIISHYNNKNNESKINIKYLKKMCKNKFNNDKEKEKEYEYEINDVIEKNIIRDNLVLKDNLYPPLNRYPLTERNIAFNNYTRDSYDTYHLVGNLTRSTDNF